MNPDDACVAALAALPSMTTWRLASLLNGRSAVEAFAVASGEQPADPTVAEMFRRRPELAGSWREAGRRRPPDEMGRWCDDLGVAVVVPGHASYPRVLLDDPQRPAALFVAGDLGALGRRRVAIVGTRHPTQRGRQTAVRFGHELSAAGVGVVSGLAMGIDGAAHRGALAADGAPPIGVVANGHDSPYPKRHADLWRAVAEHGLLISEWPPGTPPDAFRFPQRNRILAALSESVVVVESRERGGSLITAQLAAERGVDVFAVPGPVDVRASLGTNQLLRDGASAASSPDDVLVALGIDHRRAGDVRHDPRPRPRGVAADIVEFCSTEARDVEAVAERCSLSVVEAALELARLERSGWLLETGGWFEVLDRWAPLA